MKNLGKVDADALLDKVAREVARRFERNLPIAPSGGERVGPPFCAVCDKRGHCVTRCGPSAGSVLDAGADRIGGAPGIGAVEAKMPKRVKKKRPLQGDDGEASGWEEYYEYIFPEEQAKAPSLKILQMARAWKKQKTEHAGADDPHDGDGDDTAADA